MSFLGMLCLGLFVGGVIGLIMTQESQLSATSKTFTAIFCAAIGGGIGAFIQYIETPVGDAVYAYPMGLVLGFIWPFVKGSWALVREKDGVKKHPVATLHVVAVFLVSGMTFSVVMFPQFRSVLENAPVVN
mgnify:CR=1 FL=1